MLFPTRISIPSIIASVRGSFTRKVVPIFPVFLSRHCRAVTRCYSLRHPSHAAPRQLANLTGRENPAETEIAVILASAISSPCLLRPSASAARTSFLSIPPPSSLTFYKNISFLVIGAQRYFPDFGLPAGSRLRRFDTMIDRVSNHVF